MTAVRTHRIEGAGGVPLSVADAGPQDAPAVVLLHGWSQHHLCWSKQLAGPLAEEFRLIAPDLRGHGASGKPENLGAYQDSALWAGDLAAVITALGLARPVVAGWSMGGWVLSDYLRAYGDSGLAGLVYIGSFSRIGSHFEPDWAAAWRREVRSKALYSETQGEALEASIAFVKLCTAAPLSKRDLAFMVGYNMLCPPHARLGCRQRDEDWRPELSRITRPTLIMWGTAERLCLKPIFEEMAALVPDAETATYPGIGHAPFWEVPEKFDADLAAFARRAHSGVPA